MPKKIKKPGFRTVIRIRIRMFLGLLDPDILVRVMDPAPDPDPSLKGVERTKRMLAK